MSTRPNRCSCSELAADPGAASSESNTGCRSLNVPEAAADTGCPWAGREDRILRKNPRDPNAAAKYYALDVLGSLLDEEDAAHAIAVRSGLSGSILDLRLSICD